MLTRWYGVFGWLWSLPMNILSYIALGFLVLVKQAKFTRRHGWILEFETIPDTWVFKMFWEGKWAGVCMSAVIWYSHFYKDHERTILHERQHSKQAFVLGIFHPPAYWGHTLVLFAFVWNKHAYLDNWFEKDARRAAGQKVGIKREDWYQGPDDRWPWWVLILVPWGAAASSLYSSFGG